MLRHRGAGNARSSASQMSDVSQYICVFASLARQRTRLQLRQSGA